jgi:DeoR family fructose operon transcriptional repressor
VRKKTIINELEKDEIVYLHDFVSIFKNVSESTIRRDLKTLEEEGLIELLHGGAAKLKNSSSYDMPIESKQYLHTAEKDRIAKFAASLVKEGEVIYIDSGTTTLGMVKYLRSSHVQVVTSNTDIIDKIKGARFSCVMLGGEITETLGSVVGPITDSLLENLFFDKAFIGATGYSVESGITTPDFREANKKKIVKNNSKEVFVLLDSSKAGKKALCKVFDLTDCTIITDKATDILEKTQNYLLAE